MLGPECREPGFMGGEERPFCPSCLRAAADDIHALPLDYLHLAQLLLKAGGVPDEAITRPKPGSRPPIDLGVDEHMRRIVWAVGMWELILREHLSLPELPTGNVRPGFLTARGANFLVAHLADLIALPPAASYLLGYDHDPVIRDGIDAILGLRNLHAKSLMILGVTDAVIHLPGACPGCGCLQLRRFDGGDDVWCEQCKRHWPYVEYQRYVALMTVVRVDTKTP